VSARRVISRADEGEGDYVGAVRSLEACSTRPGRRTSTRSRAGGAAAARPPQNAGGRCATRTRPFTAARQDKEPPNAECSRWNSRSTEDLETRGPPGGYAAGAGENVDAGPLDAALEPAHPTRSGPRWNRPFELRGGPAGPEAASSALARADREHGGTVLMARDHAP
jgi:hypothetical protein